MCEVSLDLEVYGPECLLICPLSEICDLCRSNEDIPVTIKGDDRRYFVLGTSRRHANDLTHLAPLAALMADDSNDIALLFFRWLMSRDLTGFEVRRFPKTEARLRMQIEVRDPFFEWLQDVCMQPHNLLIGEQPNVHAAQIVLSDTIFLAYNAWFAREIQGTGQRRMTKCKLCKKLKGFLGPDSQTRGTGGIRGFSFPPVAQIQEQLKQENRWDPLTG